MDAYILIELPDGKAFRDLTGREARDYFNTFIASVPFRLAQLEAVLNADTNGTVALDYDPATIDKIQDWLATYAIPCDLSEDVIEAKKASVPAFMRDEVRTWSLSPMAYSLSADVGIYIAEMIRKIQPQARWDLVRQPKSNAYLYQPSLLLGPGRGHFHPLATMAIFALKLAEGTADKGRLMELYRVYSNT